MLENQPQNNPESTPNVNENVNVNEKAKENIAVKFLGRSFVPPTLQEVELYLKEKKIFSVSADTFVSFYESNGWKVGKNPMKNWKAAVTTWKKRNEAGQNSRIIFIS